MRNVLICFHSNLCLTAKIVTFFSRKHSCFWVAVTLFVSSSFVAHSNLRALSGNIMSSLFVCFFNLQDNKRNADETMEWAIKNGHVEVIKQLVTAGVGPKDADEWKRMSLIGFQAGFPDVVKALLEFKDTWDTTTSPLFENNGPKILRKGTPYTDLRARAGPIAA